MSDLIGMLVQPWRKMNSAPKDGTAILAHYPGTGAVGVRWCGWGSGVWQCINTGHNILSREPDGWLPQPSPPTYNSCGCRCDDALNESCHKCHPLGR